MMVTNLIQTITPQVQSATTKPCHNGQTCKWNVLGQCRYFHQGVNEPEPQGVQVFERDFQGPRFNLKAHRRTWMSNSLIQLCLKLK